MRLAASTARQLVLQRLEPGVVHLLANPGDEEIVERFEGIRAAVLAEALAPAFGGSPPTIEVRVAEPPSGARTAAERAREIREQDATEKKERLVAHPVVQELRQRLSARVVRCVPEAYAGKGGDQKAEA